jgi:hypothetical protein
MRRELQGLPAHKACQQEPTISGKKVQSQFHNLAKIVLSSCQSETQCSMTPSPRTSLPKGLTWNEIKSSSSSRLNKDRCLRRKFKFKSVSRPCAASTTSSRISTQATLHTSCRKSVSMQLLWSKGLSDAGKHKSCTENVCKALRLKTRKYKRRKKTARGLLRANSSSKKSVNTFFLSTSTTSTTPYPMIAGSNCILRCRSSSKMSHGMSRNRIYCTLMASINKTLLIGPEISPIKTASGRKPIRKSFKSMSCSST